MSGMFGPYSGVRGVTTGRMTHGRLGRGSSLDTLGSRAYSSDIILIWSGLLRRMDGCD